MALYLVVAHQTAASDELLSALQELAAREPDPEFVLLVPATPVIHLLTWTEGESLEVARATAREGAAAIRRADLNLIDTAIGDSDPLLAIEHELESRGRSYDGLVISTLPLGVSRWLRRDLPNRARSKFGVEVVHVVSRSAAHKQPVA